MPSLAFAAPEELGSGGLSENESRASLFGFPLFSANSDEGIGIGGILSWFQFTGGVKPFRNNVTLRLQITSRLVQRHEFRWEGVDVLDTPLRILLRAGIYSTLTQNFCGFGNQVTCRTDRAVAAADALGLEEGHTDRDLFVRHYYQLRYLRPFGEALVRLRLRDFPHKTEWLSGYRGSYTRFGSYKEGGPYPGSLYETLYPRGEDGFSSVLQTGVTLDNRDNERAPATGYFFEGSVRGASRLWGSRFVYSGFNLSLSNFFLVVKNPHIVVAVREIADLMFGNAPTVDMAQVGGITQAVAFGGQYLGRGIREQRFLGKVKLMQQTEVRTLLFSLRLFQQRIDVGHSIFGDFAWIGHEITRLNGDPLRLLLSLGTGLRVIINDVFVFRGEVAASPYEDRSPSFYLTVGNPF